MNFLLPIKNFIRLLYFKKKFSNSVIHKGVYLDKLSELHDHSVLFKNVTFINSRLGAYSYVQSKSLIYNADFGKFCSIASNVCIGLANHPTQMVSTSPVFYDNSQPLPKFMAEGIFFSKELPRTTIGSDVWIGYGVIIKAGVSIGVGAVIGAGSVVTKDIAPYAIAVGNPCKQIKMRFKEDVVKNLLNSKWWEFEDEKLKALTKYFLDPELFLTNYKK